MPLHTLLKRLIFLLLFAVVTKATMPYFGQAPQQATYPFNLEDNFTYDPYARDRNPNGTLLQDFQEREQKSGAINIVDEPSRTGQSMNESVPEDDSGAAAESSMSASDPNNSMAHTDSIVPSTSNTSNSVPIHNMSQNPLPPHMQQQPAHLTQNPPPPPPPHHHRRRHKKITGKQVGKGMLVGVHLLEKAAASGALGPEAKAAAIAAETAETAIRGIAKGESAKQIAKESAATAISAAVGGGMKGKILDKIAGKALGINIDANSNPADATTNKLQHQAIHQAETTAQQQNLMPS